MSGYDISTYSFSRCFYGNGLTAIKSNHYYIKTLAIEQSYIERKKNDK